MGRDGKEARLNEAGKAGFVYFPGTENFASHAYYSEGFS